MVYNMVLRENAASTDKIFHIFEMLFMALSVMTIREVEIDIASETVYDCEKNTRLSILQEFARVT